MAQRIAQTEGEGEIHAVPAELMGELGRIRDRVEAAASLTAMVLAALSGLRSLGQTLVRAALEARDAPYRDGQAVVSCRGCGQRMQRQRNVREKGRMTLLGQVRYRRCRYACSGCKRRVFPLDEQVGVSATLRGHSREFAQALVLTCTVMPYGKGRDLFHQLCGVMVSTQLCRTLTLIVGTQLYRAEMARAEELWEKRHQQPELFEPPPAKLRPMKRHQRIYVMPDNSKVGVHDGKRGRGAPQSRTIKKIAQQQRRQAIRAAKRAKPGPTPPPVADADVAALTDEESWRDIRGLLIFTEAEVKGTGTKGRRQIEKRRVLGHVGSKAEWTRLVHMALHEEGVYTAREVVIVADGGSGIWELFTELLPQTPQRKVVQILDWYHAVQKLWGLGRQLKGYQTKAQRKACTAWVKGLLDYLAEGRTANVVQRLHKIKAPPASAQKELENTITYFTDHRHRMAYQRFRAAGLTIGSGAIESVHAWVFQARCRLPGMRWSLAGANAMLRLRCSWASGRWDEDFLSAANAPPLNPKELRAAA